MMQNGLHIGLAAWVSQQRSSASFTVYPATPIVSGLVDLGSMENIHDLAKASEFSRLVNFIPRRGQIADVFSSSAVLWRVHSDILHKMDFATNPWGSADQAQFQVAQELLYATDASGLKSPSQKYLLYLEMRSAFRDLSQTGGPQEEIAQAMVRWVTLGYKQEIEDALEVIVRLLARSSRERAQQEASSLNDVPPGVGLCFYNDLEFAPTYFAPISAIARDTWLQAKVTFADLDRAVAKGPATEGWDLFFSNRVGEVIFDYVVVTCIRPWYTPALYKTDDWRLSSADSLVSKGNGVEGFMPAYVDEVYFTSIQSVTIQSTQPSQPHHIPFDPRWGGVRDVNPALAERWKIPLNDIARTRNRRLLSDEIKAPVMSVAVGGVSNGQIIKLSTANLDRRYKVTRALIDREAWKLPLQTAVSPSDEVYVVGFGCQSIPFSPNPNIDYRW